METPRRDEVTVLTMATLLTVATLLTMAVLTLTFDSKGSYTGGAAHGRDAGRGGTRLIRGS